MGSSRKRQREFRRLKGTATDVLDEQREVLDHAGKVLREARRQLGNYAKDDVAPRVAGAYNERVRPTIVGSIAGARAAATVGRTRVADDVIPAVSGAIGSTLAVLEAAKDPRVRELAKQAGKKSKSFAKQARKNIRPASTGPGPGTYIAIGLGIVAFAAVAYAAWQTLRADDDLWIEDVADDASSAES